MNTCYYFFDKNLRYDQSLADDVKAALDAGRFYIEDATAVTDEFGHVVSELAQIVIWRDDEDEDEDEGLRVDLCRQMNVYMRTHSYASHEYFSSEHEEKIFGNALVITSPYEAFLHGKSASAIHESVMLAYSKHCNSNSNSNKK